MEFCRVSPDVKLGKDVKIFAFVNLYGCTIGDGTKVGTFVEIQKNAFIGKNCKISSHTFICEGVTVEDDVFIGHNVTFINDMYPRSTIEGGGLQTEADWKVVPTFIKKGASVDRGRRLRRHQGCGSLDDRGRQSGQGLAQDRKKVDNRRAFSN
jgi:UDP-2-acetamido-3-amino-2,3-dideoxy-glucuronate N-acetyltransferase